MIEKSWFIPSCYDQSYGCKLTVFTCKLVIIETAYCVITRQHFTFNITDLSANITKDYVICGSKLAVYDIVYMMAHSCNTDRVTYIGAKQCSHYLKAEFAVNETAAINIMLESDTVVMQPIRYA